MDTTRDEHGNLTAPPVNRDYEQRLRAAANDGDADALIAIQGEYDGWRNDQADAANGAVADDTEGANASTTDKPRRTRVKR